MLKTKILEILKEAGINDAGFCAFSFIEDKILECRAKMRLPQNAKTVIMCAFPYKVSEEKPINISRYAAVKDYHEIVGKYLSLASIRLKEKFPNNNFEWFVDNSPIPEVYAAALSGIGVRGDNNLLITPKYGSWVFLGEIVTDIEIKTENKYSECLHCGKCSSACPKKKCEIECLSEISQKKRELTEMERNALKENNILWGCDICADVCPMNKNVLIKPLPDFILEYRERYVPNEEISGRAYAWRGEKVILRNWKILNE